MKENTQKQQFSNKFKDGQQKTCCFNMNFLHGYLHKRTSDSNKWQLRWFILYQNLLFYYDSETSTRPLGLIFLEGCYCERLVSAPSYLTSTTSANNAQSSSNSSKISKEEKLQT
uniref:CSON014623 protein n=1 Tax=Culicoides sonorensis TaxID=179676 RepID=A0A336LMH0_CULSO